MLILLPPSEGKTAPSTGRPLDLERLIYPVLASQRRAVIEALISASHLGPQAISAPPTTGEEVLANTTLWEAPTAPAARVYTGVLFEAAGLAKLAKEADQRAQEHVRIASTVFGFLSPADEIPAYRLPPAAKLPEVGAPLAFLAPAVDEVMELAELIVDCRSGPYLRLWRPRGVPWVMVKVVEIRGGKRVVVSHHAKHTRGVLTHYLLTRAGAMPRTVDELQAAAEELIGDHLHAVDVSEGKPGTHVLELTVA